VRGSLTNAGSTTYGYDGENRLTSGPNATQLSYNPEGQLIRVASSSGGAAKFLYDRTDLAAEYDDSGALLCRYVHGGVDEPLVWYEGPLALSG
jgi:hypothetical protein